MRTWEAADKLSEALHEKARGVVDEIRSSVCSVCDANTPMRLRANVFRVERQLARLEGLYLKAINAEAKAYHARKAGARVYVPERGV